MQHGIAILINQALALDARTPARLLTLQGKHLDIKVTSVSKTIHIAFVPTGIQFVKGHITPPDVIAEGPVKAFFTLALTKNSIKAAQQGLRFEGDLTTAEAIQTLFLSLDIDWEELLSHGTGDALAHHIGHIVRQTKKYQQEFFQSMSDNTSLYLTEEANLLPTQTEAAEFMEAVDKLRADVDRLEAKIERLTPELKTDQPDTNEGNDS